MRHGMLALLGVLGGAVVASCAGETTQTTTTATGMGAQAGTAGAGGATAGAGGQGGATPTCDTAVGSLPTDLTELAYDSGEPVATLREQTWSIDTGTHEYLLNEEPLNESVRFELLHPARVWGFRVMWAALPEGLDPATALEAGLYPDFGYNGFDFWPEPLWTGSRCASAAAEGQWVTYALAEPIELGHPGLVYVAHRLTQPAGPVWPFDVTVQGPEGCEDDGSCCNRFDDCQSSMNLPEAETSSYFNGVTFPFQYHYLVRLLVEYTDDLEPSETLFQRADSAPTGNHVSWGDYDADGWDDLLLDGTRLYHNEGDGTFTDATASSGIGALSLGGTGGVFGDYDNDGCLDLVVFAESYQQPDTLLHNECDGTFVDVTAAAGIVDEQSYNYCNDAAEPKVNIRSPTAAAAWLDIDADGWLDLYLANFICWETGSNYRDTVLHNQGDGTFTDWSAQYGFSSLRTPSRCTAPVDHDRDGDVDLFVGNYRLVANLFFQNDGAGSVTEIGHDHGLAGVETGSYYGHTIGAAWGDIDADGDFDLVAANLAHPRFFDFSNKTQVLLNAGAGSYEDLAGDWAEPVSGAGLRYQETHSVPLLADFDADGTLDLVITCVYDGRPTDFYWGLGDGTFQLDSYHAGITTENGWGVAASDYDHDGDVDLFATGLFDNRLAAADQGHFLAVRVVGTTANRAAIGATVAVDVGAVTLLRHVQGGTGKGGQDSLSLHFGLGVQGSVDAIRVTFPGGATVTYSGPIDADQQVWIRQDGSLVPGWAPPGW